jgi:hypothetical protein
VVNDDAENLPVRQRKTDSLLLRSRESVLSDTAPSQASFPSIQRYPAMFMVAGCRAAVQTLHFLINDVF